MKAQFSRQAGPAPIIQGVAFINDIADMSDGWGMLAPFGDYPGQALIRQPDGSIKKIPAIQRIDREAANGMVTRFKSLFQRVRRFTTGCPVYDGHADVPSIANDCPDKIAKGTIVDLEVRDKGLYCKPVFTNEGSDLIESKKRRAFSGYWDAVEIGLENGVRIYRPTLLISAALTNRPNLPVQLLNEKETTNTSKNIMKKELVIALLAASGISIANEATDDQVSEGLKQLGEKITTLAGEKAALANEKETLIGEIATLKSEQAALTAGLGAIRTRFANARKAHITDLIGSALATGRITVAEKPAWEIRLANEAAFVNEAAAIQALRPVVKTESVTCQIGNRQVSIANAAERREVVEGLVQEEMKTNGGDYAKAHASIQRRHPALFQAMASPKIKMPRL